MTIFLVEDSAAIQERFLREFAAIPGLEVLGVADRAEEAIAAIERVRPDLVVLDLQLVSGSGIDVLRASQAWSPRPRFWVVSNVDDLTTRALVSRSGAERFYDKSSETETFLAALAQAASESSHSGG